ncbi:MAG: peptidase S41, partial [Bacteroidales bacterium]|nr:peptidase S41 [Bacteroidales bacterium]
MKNKIAIYLPLLFAVILVFGIFLGYKLTPVTSVNQQLFQLNLKKYNKFNDVIYYIEQDYVDSVNRDALMEDGISGILQNLDPHSQYIPAEDFHEVNDP